MDPTNIAELILVIAGWVGANKGLEAWKRHRFSNGNGLERRRNSFSESDKSFISGCFDSLEKTLEIGRLSLFQDLSKTIREESQATRTAVRDR